MRRPALILKNGFPP